MTELPQQLDIEDCVEAFNHAEFRNEKTEYLAIGMETAAAHLINLANKIRQGDVPLSDGVDVVERIGTAIHVSCVGITGDMRVPAVQQKKDQQKLRTVKFGTGTAE